MRALQRPIVGTALLLLVAISCVAIDGAVANNIADEKTARTGHKRLGRRKKKVDGRVYASYGLSPAKSDPARIVAYSAEAVSVASSSAQHPAAAASSSASSSSSSSSKKNEGRERADVTSAPGAQAKVDLRPFMSAVEDQKQTNSCAANAVAGAYEYLATRAAIRDGEIKVGDISRLFIYYVGRKRDQINWNENTRKRPKDEGMTLGGAIEAVQLKGAALQATWPFDMRKVNHRPHDEAFIEAMRYKVGDAMYVPLDLDQMRQCMSDGYPIIFGLKLTRAFFNPPRDGYIPTPDPTDPKSAEHGLHAMLLVGYNDRQRVFIVRNSWGEQWGVNGYAYLSYDYVANEDFNFLGMYAIQSLTDDDLTPDDDDGEDIEFEDHSDLHDVGADLDVNDLEDDEEDDEDDEDFDADDMFDTRAEARRAFGQFAGDNLRLSKDELKNALTLMGVPMVTDGEVDMAFRRYDDDGSGYVSFEEFLDMHALFDGSLLWRRRKFKSFKEVVNRWFGKAWKLFGGGRRKEVATEL